MGTFSDTFGDTLGSPQSKKIFIPTTPINTNVLTFSQSLNALDWTTNQTTALDFDISFRFDCAGSVKNWMPFCNATGTYYLLFDNDNRIKMRINSTVYDLSGADTLKRWTWFKYGMIEWRFVKSGTTLSIYVNRDIYFTATIPDLAFQFRWFGRWNSTNAYDAVGDLEWITIDGTTYTTANSWGGKTLTNLTAIQRSYGEHLQSYIVTGQSNAVARNGVSENAFTGITFPIAYSKYYNDTALAYQDTIFGINQAPDTAGNWGVEYRIAKRLSLNNKEHYVLKFGVGGTAITSWEYNGSVNYLRQILDMAGKSKRQYKNFIFIQGETDALTEVNSLAYEARLRSTIKYLRMGLINGFNTKFIFLKLANFTDPSQIYRANIQTAQENVAADTANVSLITPPIGWTSIDNTHYDAVTIDTISNLMYLQLQN